MRIVVHNVLIMKEHERRASSYESTDALASAPSFLVYICVRVTTSTR